VLTIHSGDALVVASGEVTTFFGAGLVFEVAPGPVATRVALRFFEDADAPEPRVTVEQEGETLRMNLVNFREGKGSSEPVLVRRLDEGLLFFHFRVFRHGRTADHTVHYTFFLSPESGWTVGAVGG
jgi:hypothetical protein